MRIYILGIFCIVIFPALVYSQGNVTEVDEGGSCGGIAANTRKCKEGLECILESNTPDALGTCRKPKPPAPSPSGPGGPCKSDSDCSSGLTCSSGSCKTPEPTVTTITSASTITRTTVKPTTTVITSVQTTVVDSKTSLITLTTAVSTDAPVTEVEVVTNTAVVTNTPGKRPVGVSAGFGGYLQLSFGALVAAIVGALLL